MKSSPPSLTLRRAEQRAQGSAETRKAGRAPKKRLTQIHLKGGHTGEQEARQTYQPTFNRSHKMEPQADRIRNVLAGAFRGIHHCPKIHKFYEGTRDEMWEVNPYGEISTFDFDVLTRLVVAAHDECVRVGISTSGPGMFKIRLWPRFSRDGKFYDKHPTIEQAIEKFRGVK